MSKRPVHRMGLSVALAALFVAAIVNLVVTTLAAWRAAVYFEHTRMQATRRQLARLGIGDGDDDEVAPS